MSRYGWVITKDFLATAESGPEGTNMNSPGVSGPRGLSIPLEMIKRNGRRFEMLDDDGVLYYEGFGLNCGGEEPLHDFGMPNAGCTKIRWLSSGEEFHGDELVQRIVSLAAVIVLVKKMGYPTDFYEAELERFKLIEEADSK